ncbi:MAG: tRNA-binding protein [Candidatus Micrarchaeota archaeon]|nr:tRNA-binding protein [Candidatus Micrarchaeota archaeon]MDE1824584.1 tRNA-binding protein [Candidatus Micrarchaeota archaeon]MDE1850072.1 tRNA-binding protein [Candidatus Micrarchaeota archaeon]
MVSINDFAAIDIRIGKIVGIEEHSAARKPMYKLVVDFGAEIGKRTIIAGIRALYSQEELLGRKVACVVNLEPKMIAGIESQGMLLAAGDESSISILVPYRDVEIGSRIR